MRELFVDTEVHQSVMTDIGDQLGVTIDADRVIFYVECVFRLSCTAAKKVDRTLSNEFTIISVRYQKIVFCPVFEDHAFEADGVDAIAFPELPFGAFFEPCANSRVATPVKINDRRRVTEKCII